MDVTGVHEFPGTSYCGSRLWDEDQSLEIVSPGCRHPAPNMGGETAPSVVTRVCWTWSTCTRQAVVAIVYCLTNQMAVVMAGGGF